MNVRSAEIDNHKGNMCCAKQRDEVNLPKVPIRQWEKKLQQETSEKSVDVITQNAEEQEKLYFQNLQVFGRLMMLASYDVICIALSVLNCSPLRFSNSPS